MTDKYVEDRILAYCNELMRILSSKEVKALRNLCEKIYEDGFQDGVNEGLEPETPDNEWRWVKMITEKEINKLEIAMDLMQKYAQTFKSKNSFYYCLKGDIETLRMAISNPLSDEDRILIVDILEAKKLKYGNFEHNFEGD